MSRSTGPHLGGARTFVAFAAGILVWAFGEALEWRHAEAWGIVGASLRVLIGLIFLSWLTAERPE